MKLVTAPKHEFRPVQPFRRREPKTRRNDPCWCGSGKKAKHCHLALVGQMVADIVRSQMK